MKKKLQYASVLRLSDFSNIFKVEYHARSIMGVSVRVSLKGNTGLYTFLFHQQKLRFHSLYVGPLEDSHGSETIGPCQDTSQPLKSSIWSRKSPILGEGRRSPVNLVISPSTHRFYHKSSILGRYLRPSWPSIWSRHNLRHKYCILRSYKGGSSERI